MKLNVQNRRNKCFLPALIFAAALALSGCGKNLSGSDIIREQEEKVAAEESGSEKRGNTLFSSQKAKDLSKAYLEKRQKQISDLAGEFNARIHSVTDKDSTVTQTNETAGFTPEELEKAKDSYLTLSQLDSLGRVGPAIGSFCEADIKNNGREDISEIYPSGWKQTFYDISITGSDQESLYNRCHLIMEAISDNSSPENLFTGTRQCNLDMLNWEEKITDYIYQNPDTHVLYRVTPVFSGDNLVCEKVVLEAESVEDYGEGLNFKVDCNNIENGITIDYSTGDSHLTESGKIEFIRPIAA